MKNLIMSIVLAFSALFAVTPVFAEASFDQIQTLIQKQEYRAAEKGLEEIISNHPNSAKAFYAMAQAQAGLGNLTKAQHALDKAMGLNPELNFAPKSSVENLKQAIHPQVAKIEVIEESHFWRNILLFILFVSTFGIAYYFYDKNEKKKAKLQKELEESRKARSKEAIERSASLQRDAANTRSIQKVQPKKDQKIYPGGDPNLPTPVAVPVSSPIVVNNTTSNNSATDFMLGAAMGHIMTANSNGHKEVVRERVIEREVPAKDSSWDNAGAVTQEAPKSSSWDDSPVVSTGSSSWDSRSSSSRSSSWDSDSSSSSSSSSWDSGSSDSGSSSGSWD